MRMTVSGRQIKLTEGIKNYIDNKFSKLDKYLAAESELRVTVSAIKDRQKVEVTIDSINGHVVRAEESQKDLYAAIDLVCDKLTRQIVKYKNKFRHRTAGHDSIRFENFEKDFTVDEDDVDVVGADEKVNFVRKKRFNIKPMSADEAVLQMNLLGHNFFVFKDQENFEVSVVYKRRDGGYGIIEQD